MCLAADAGCWLGTQLGQASCAPTRGHGAWFSHNMVADSERQQLKSEFSPETHTGTLGLPMTLLQKFLNLTMIEQATKASPDSRGGEFESAF